MPEVAGDAPVYFNPEDAEDANDLAGKLLQVTSIASLRASLVDKGFRRLKKFSYEECAVRTAAILNAMIADRARSSAVISVSVRVIG